MPRPPSPLGPLCTLPGCTRERIYAELCNAHYRRLRRVGSIDAATPIRKRWVGVPLHERFWAFVDKTGGGECWTWTGRRNAPAGRDPQTYGYARITVDKRIIPATHVAWYLANGEYPPDGLMVCHHCDNPPCVRPSHLFLGTQADNMRDAKAKGRVRNKATKASKS